MKVKAGHDFQACVPGAFEGGPARTAYFDGMVLSESDMLREQAYWRTKRRLTNRALGQGVVWGLGVHWDARSRRFCISPGYGLSCCGDDLVVECAQTVREDELIDPCGEDLRRLLAHAAQRHEHAGRKRQPDAPVDACLLLEYVECPEDPRQLFKDACAHDSGGCRYGAVRETTRLRLVPPPPPAPPDAVAAFCERIDALRAELEGVEGAVVEPLLSLDSARAKVEVAFVDGGTVSMGQSTELVLRGGKKASVSVSTPAGLNSSTKLRVGIEPPPGHVFTAATVAGTPLPAASVLMGAFDAIAVPGPPVVFVLDVVPLFGTAAGYRVSVKLRAAPGPTSGIVVVGAEVAEDAEPLPARQDCASLLAGGLLSGADCTLRVLALALLYGWFKSGLSAAPCAEPHGQDGAAPSDKVRLLLAWTIYRLAWRALFGIDTVAAQAEDLEKHLLQLLTAWCEGLRYKGPRCDVHVHGIVLGCLQVSPKGRVLCFDAWAHRRHVLTGPLLMHWAGVVGMAPLDSGVARLARWLCCVAREPLPALPDALQSAELTVLPFAQGAVAVAQKLVPGQVIGTATLKRAEPVGAPEFVRRALGMLMADGGGGTLASAQALQAWSAPGNTLHLLQSLAAAPAQAVKGAAPAPAADALLAEVLPSAVTLPASARLPIRDFIVAHAEAVELKQLKPLPELPRQFETMVEALEGAGITTLADLVQLGPEPALLRLQEQQPQHAALADMHGAEKALAVVYERAVKTLAGVGEAVVARAKASAVADPFTRSDLKEERMLNSLRRLLNEGLRERAGLSGDALKRIARAVAGP